MRGACDEQTCDEWFPTKQECSQKCKPAAALTVMMTGTCYGNGTIQGFPFGACNSGILERKLLEI